jgi:hypothetical protein
VLGGPLHQSAPVKAHATLRVSVAIMFFFLTHGSLCKRYVLCLIKHCICLSYCHYMCDLNIMGTRMEASVPFSRTGV